MVAKTKAEKKKKEDDDDEEKKEEEVEDDDEDKEKKKKKGNKKADDFPTGTRKWFYNPETSGLETDVMGIKAEVAIFGNPKNWAEVELSPVNKQVGTYKSKFRIEYCWDNGTNLTD